MSSRIKYKIIAAFLLLVFSFNSVVGFACSVGVDMGYNSSHHKHDDEAKPHSHAKLHPQGHSHASQHHSHAYQGINIKETNDDCCANGVTKFSQLDKSIVSASSSLEVPALHSTFLFSTSIQPTKEIVVNHNLRFVRRSCFLNDTDIRIAIQSFQI